jgi:sugar O-acyltransferase (sialic acid O-acetyltransferase NeuD family)
MVVADIFERQDKYELVAFVDDVNPGRSGTLFCGLPVLGGVDVLEKVGGLRVRSVALGVGDISVRRRLADLLLSRRIKLATAIHPSSAVARTAVVGEGSVVAAGSVIGPHVHLGMCVIVNSGASVDHECVVGDYVNLSPGVHLGGGVTVGRDTFLGIGAVVADHLTVGGGSKIGAGAVVLDDIPDRVLAYGVPARIVGKAGGS